MAVRKPTCPWTLYVIAVCLLLIAVNALAAGASMLSDPSGAGLGMTLELLANSPFPDFFIPGLFLFFVNGVGSLFVLYALWTRPDVPLLPELTRATHEHWAWTAALVLSAVLVVWIIIQYFMIQTFSVLQVVVVALALLIAALDVLPGTRRYYAEKA